VRRYAFCPVCGGPLDRSVGDGVTQNLFICGSCGYEFWQNSKPAVGALIVRVVDGKPHVLLTRRGIEPYKGMWDLPGGYLSNGEHPEAGLLRELREELGTTAMRPRFLTAEVDEYPLESGAEEARFVLSLYYRCDIAADADLTPGDDVVGAEWFPLEALPEAIAFACNRRALNALRNSMVGSPQGSSPAG
jgi:ADP-ribose pyrophosphatase YjhB (NUDIX family)